MTAPTSQCTVLERGRRISQLATDAAALAVKLSACPLCWRLCALWLQLVVGYFGAVI